MTYQKEMYNISDYILKVLSVLTVSDLIQV